MRIKNYLLLISSLLLGSAACKKDAPCSMPVASQDNIQGKWAHQYPADPEPGFTQPDKYDHLRFVHDSFYLQKTFVTDALVPGCGTTEYAKGVFRLDEGKLLLNGVYTEADYSIKTSPCNHTGAFAGSYNIRFCKETLHLYWLDGGSLPERYKTIALVRE